ncbi:MAG: TetR/AcrR family transcriptional regulator [Spirochaetes bacterium]|nr:TetR/AcrR family transcriptional regulator [Spirochaetota bacterium]
MNKKDLIIDTAIEILKESNYHNMKTSIIAKKLNIAEGTIYIYFNSKKEIFIEAIEKVSNNLLNFFIDIIDKERSLKENLENLANNFLINNEFFFNNYNVLYKSFSEVDDDKIKEKLSLIFDKSISYIYEKITQIKELTNKKIEKEKIKLIILFLWGLGDISWKKWTISNKNLIEEFDYRIIVDFIYSLLEI